MTADSERVLGPDHGDTLAARENLATFYRFAGRTADALVVEERDVQSMPRAVHKAGGELVPGLRVYGSKPEVRRVPVRGRDDPRRAREEGHDADQAGLATNRDHR